MDRLERGSLFRGIRALLARAGRPLLQGLALVPLLLAGPVHAQTIGPNLNLTRATGNQYETAVAINPNNNQQIFVVSRNELGGLYGERSNDGGLTWTSRLFATVTLPQPGDVPRAYGNASVAWDSFGNLFLVYLSQSSTKSPATYVALAVSTDGGASFYSPSGSGSALLLPYNTCPCLIGDQPTVTVGPGSGGSAGSVWVTYFSQGGIWVSGAGVSGLGLVGAFTSQPLPSQPVGVNFGDIAVGPNGEVMVTYGPDSGASGAIYTNIDDDGLGPHPFSTYAVATAVNLGGFSYIPAQPNWGIDPEAGLAYDRSNGPHRGRVYLVYTDTATIGSTDTDIFVRYSDDAGTSWSAPVRVNDDAGTNSQFLPRIALDQTTGSIAVTWYDARNAVANETAQYFGAFSIDGGASFGANFQLSTGTSDQARSIAALKKADYGDYTGNAFVDGLLIPAWADNSNSTGDNPDGATNFDVYVATVQAPPAVPPDFSLAAAPASQSVLPGNDAIYSVTLTPTGGFNGVVSYSVSGLPSGASGVFDGTTLTVTTSVTTPVGSYPLTITGVSGSLTHTASVTLSVVPGFALSAMPASQTVAPGHAVTYTIAVTDLGGFKGKVSLAISGVPANVSAHFYPKSAARTSWLRVTASRKAAAGTYVMAVTGTSGSLSQSIPVTLVVSAAN